MHGLSINLISTDEDPILRIESFAIINLRSASTAKLYFNLIITMQTCKALLIVHTVEKFRVQTAVLSATGSYARDLSEINSRVETWGGSEMEVWT